MPQRFLQGHPPSLPSWKGLLLRVRHGYDARVAEVPLPMQAGLELPAAALKLAQVMVQVSVLGSAQVQEPVQGLEPALAELSAEALALPEV